LLLAGIATLAIGFAMGLQVVPRGVSGTMRPADFDSRASFWASFEPQRPDNSGFRLASLETEAISLSATEAGQSWSVRSTGGYAVSAEDPASNSHVVSFNERFAALFGSPSGAPTAQTVGRQPSPNQGGHTAPGSTVNQRVASLIPLPAAPPAGLSKKQSRTTDGPEEPITPPDVDAHTAIYDISAHTVYLPSGQRLEAHSGFGSRLDDPRYVSEKDLGPTPPNVYDLSLRAKLFHGVRAIRLNPVGGAGMFGREGLLAHSYMLGPNGQSNGCVSISDYPVFFNAFMSGEINRLVVFEHLSTPPNPTALGWLRLPETIRVSFRTFLNTGPALFDHLSGAGDQQRVPQVAGGS
jgi:hypothetical protein